MWLLYVVYLFIATAKASQRIAHKYIDEKGYDLPQFTKLDNYDKCMSNKDAMYCLGTFRILSNSSNVDYFNHIQKYSNISNNYDRTFFHRGYCMSSRCSLYSKTPKGFEKCVQSANKGLYVTLTTLHACQEKTDTNVNSKVARLHTLDWCYIIIILLILILNIVGTIHGGKVNNFWRCWCIRSNWHKVVQPFGDDDDTRAFAPIQGLRVLLMTAVIFVHVIYVSAAAFLYDPNYFEQRLISPTKVWLTKISTAVQVFYVLSAFLTAYNLLQISKKQILSMGMLQKQIIKRYFRIAPVHLLFVAFAATLWPHISDGPVWTAKIGRHSALCSKTFWTHVLHINNININACEICLPHTWSLAVDIQFQIISLVMTIFLVNYYHVVKIRILTILLMVSYVFNTGVAYIYNAKPTLLVVDGKFVRTQGMDLPFYPYYYVSPWGSLPSCLLGLILAHVYYNWRESENKLADYKLLNILCRYSFPLLLLWIVLGQFTLQLESRLILAAYLGAERPVFSFLACIIIFSLIASTDSPMRSFLSWRGWVPLGRLSLSVLLVHWMVIETHVFNQTQPVELSLNNGIMDFLSSWCLSYILAVPVTVLVELPVINTHKYFTSRTDRKIGNGVQKKIFNGHNGHQEEKNVNGKLE